MSRHVRVLYEWRGQPGHEHLEQKGWISEARLRAWEYRQDSRNGWTYDAGNFHDTVRPWRTARADLRVPEELLVGDYEERRLE